MEITSFTFKLDRINFNRSSAVFVRSSLDWTTCHISSVILGPPKLLTICSKLKIKGAISIQRHQWVVLEKYHITLIFTIDSHFILCSSPHLPKIGESPKIQMVTVITRGRWRTIFGFYRWSRSWSIGWPPGIGRIIIGRHPIINVSTKGLSWSGSNQSQGFAGTYAPERPFGRATATYLHRMFFWMVRSFVYSCDPAQKYYQHPMSKSIWFLAKSVLSKRKQQQHAKHWIHYINSSCRFGNRLPAAYFRWVPAFGLWVCVCAACHWLRATAIIGLVSMHA